jgi:hypothetical protein
MLAAEERWSDMAKSHVFTPGTRNALQVATEGGVGEEGEYMVGKVHG